MCIRDSPEGEPSYNPPSPPLPCKSNHNGGLEPQLRKTGTSSFPYSITDASLLLRSHACNACSGTVRPLHCNGCGSGLQLPVQNAWIRAGTQSCPHHAPPHHLPCRHLLQCCPNQAPQHVDLYLRRSRLRHEVSNPARLSLEMRSILIGVFDCGGVQHLSLACGGLRVCQRACAHSGCEHARAASEAAGDRAHYDTPVGMPAAGWMLPERSVVLCD